MFLKGNDFNSSALITCFDKLDGWNKIILHSYYAQISVYLLIATFSEHNPSPFILHVIESYYVDDFKVAVHINMLNARH